MSINRTITQIQIDILDWFEGHDKEFIDAIELLDGLIGYLDDNCYYDMDEIDEMFADTSASEILNRVFNGYDDDDFYTDQFGRVVHAKFNPYRKYFTTNGYGYLISSDTKDYSGYRSDGYVITRMMNERSQIPTINANPELSALFDELEAAASPLRVDPDDAYKDAMK